MECRAVLCLCSGYLYCYGKPLSQNSQELAVLWDYKVKYDCLIFLRVASCMISTTEDSGGADS